jgi:hypothetical protein
MVDEMSLCSKQVLLPFSSKAMLAAFGVVVALLTICHVNAQEQFASGDAPTYSDQFSNSCIQSEPPNPFKQAGMNPLVCRGVMAPQASNGQCNLAGLVVLSHVGTSCYYCSPISMPPNAIIIPFDQVGQATNQGFQCGADQVDPNCMAICWKSSGTKYTPPPVTGGAPTPTPTSGDQGPFTASTSGNGPCEDYTGLDMNTAAGRAAAYQRCSDSLCQHNPDLERCKQPQVVTIQSTQQVYEPVSKPLQGGLTVTRLKGDGTALVDGKVKGKTVTSIIPLGIDLGPLFPKTGLGTMAPEKVWTAAGYAPDPNIVVFTGSLDKTGKIFTLTSITFTEKGQAKYGVPATYNYAAGRGPSVALSEYQANVE